MTPEQWEKLNRIFGDALEREPSTREAFAREQAKEDGELLQEVLRLLEVSDCGTQLSRPAFMQARPLGLEPAPKFAARSVLANRFRVVRLIAQGGMGEVYEAEDLELGERIALKAIRQRVANTDLRALLKREIQLARRVTHPNVCRIFDLHEDTTNGESTLLLSMELIEGQTLAEYLLHNGPMTFRDALPIIEDVAAGLQAVHDAGIIHGDLKPANVMLVSGLGELPHARVMDFGLALPRAQVEAALGKASSESPQRSRGRGSPEDQPSVVLAGSPLVRGGTPDYLSPEQSEGGLATTASDVYALALMIGDILGVPRPERLKPNSQRMPISSARALRRCLAEDPGRRYSRPIDLATTLRRSEKSLRRIAIRAVGTALLAGILVAAFLARRMEPSGTAAKGKEALRRQFADLMRIATRTPPPGTAKLLIKENDRLLIRSVSPDGRSVVLESLDPSDLAVRDIDLGKTRQLTHRNAALADSGAGNAIFSPDGRRIAYEWHTSRTESELRIINTDGTGESRTLYHGSNVAPMVVDWSPDGGRILANLRRNGLSEQIALISIRDGSVRLPSIPPSAHSTRLLFAGDGTGIVFDVQLPRNSGTEIHRASFGGVESTLVGSTGNYNSIIGWSPDRRKLIFVSDRGGQAGIWGVSVSNERAAGKPQELVPNTNSWTPLGITRRGALLLRQNGTLYYDAPASSRSNIYSADLDADMKFSRPAEIAVERFMNSNAGGSLSPDGERLAYISRRQGLVVRTLETGEDRLIPSRVPVTLGISLGVLWFPDGRSVLAASSDVPQGPVRGLYRIDLATGAAEFLLSRSVHGVSLSRDGKAIFYADFNVGPAKIFRFDLESKREIELKAVDGTFRGVAVSPDGKLIAYSALEKGFGQGSNKGSYIAVMPSSGGESRELFRGTLWDGVARSVLSWSPDQRYVLFVRDGTATNSPSALWRVPISGGTAEQWGPSVRRGVLTFPQVHPDGRRIFFTHTDWGPDEVWALPLPDGA